MERSRLPLPSLLGLFGALLMLSSELVLGIPEALSDLPFIDPGVRKALAFAVEQYNQDRVDSTNYFKLLRFLRAQSQEIGRNEYRLTVDLVKVACKKTAGMKRKYRWIQRCEQLPGDQEKPNCYFRVMTPSPPREMSLAMTDCT